MNAVLRRLLFVACIGLAAILVAGCGTDERAPEPPAELEDQLGFSQEGIIERQSRAEASIRECMRAQGFEYTPVDPLAQRQAVTGKARLTDEEFLKQFGYGISTLYGRGNAQSDPNEGIRRSLPAADRQAYDRALFGDNPGLTFAEAVDSGDFTELGGCTKQATEDVFGGTGTLSRLQGKLDELDERIVQDQRMVGAIEKWAGCIGEKGFRYEEPDEIDGDIFERFERIVGRGVRAGATTPAPGASYDRQALSGLQRDEVRTANADLACEQAEITPVEQTVRPQYEKDFRDQNKQLLDRVRPVGQ